MTLQVPLKVRLITSRADMQITRDLRDLSYRSAVGTGTGGFASAQFSLSRPLHIRPQEGELFAKVRISDGRHGGLLWEGRTQELGREAGSDGSVYDFSAIGPAGYTQDLARPRIWVDSSNELWLKSRFALRSSRVEKMASDTDDEVSSLRLIHQEGMSYGAVIVADAMYRAIYDCGQQLGRVRADVINAGISAILENRIVTRQAPGGAGTNVHVTTWNTASTLLVGSRGGANAIPANHDVVSFRTALTSGSETANPNRWADLTGVVVVALRKDINGADLTAGSDNANNYVLAHQVLIDMIGRGDMPYDPAASSISTAGTVQIDQLAFPGGVTPAEVIDELLDLEVAFYAAAWESSIYNGKHRFEWQPWPTTIRYEAEVSDGFSGPTSGSQLYDQCLVSYIDWVGRPRTVLRTQTVPELGSLHRTLMIDLGSETSSLANAQRKGDQALADHRYIPNAGTATVARPVLDRYENRMVMPWEIRPGNLILVRGIESTPDALNTSGRTGVTVFRIAAVEVSASNAAATLELDTWSRSTARALAALHRRARTARPRRLRML